MPTTRKQKEARKSRGIEMLSDIENLDIMLGENHFNRSERDESLTSNWARRQESTIEDEFENDDENRQLDSRDVGPSTNAKYGQNSLECNSTAEINKLSSELNSKLSGDLDEMMSSVNTQIQRAISDAISSQILPQIQTALNAESGQTTQNRWNVPSERPEVNSEETYGEKVKKTIEVSGAMTIKTVVILTYALTTTSIKQKFKNLIAISSRETLPVLSCKHQFYFKMQLRTFQIYSHFG